MHAICAGQITCPAKGCHQPGTVKVVHATPPQRYEKPDGTVGHHEMPAVALEYCARHAAQFDQG